LGTKTVSREAQKKHHSSDGQGVKASSADIFWLAWLITFTGAAINVVLGSYYSWSIIGKAVSKEWGWSQTQSSLPFALVTVSFSLTMIFAGRLQDKVGPRLVAIAGGLLLGGAMILASFFKGPLTVALIYGLLGGAGIAVGHSGTVPAALKWVPPHRKGLASGIVVAGVGLAALLNSPLASYLLSAFGIQGTFRIMGIGTAVIVFALGIIMRNPPEGFRSAATRAATIKSPATSRDWNWPEMLKTPQFYGVWFMYVLSAAPALMIIANAVQILSLPANQTFNPVLAPMIIVSCSTGGRILGGYVSDWIGRRRTLVAVFLLQALNVAGLSLHETQLAFMAAFALAGLLYGSFFALLPAVMSDFYGLKHFGVNYGIIGTAFGTAGLLGTQLGGYVKDLVKTYDPVYWIFAGMLGTASLLAFLTRTPRR
jgi:OFA family oxalate/formate antiporter-like MFS transporter